jgi:hypothetical protein
MRFACPFCRRKPTVKTLVRFNPRAATLGGLQQAMDDRRFFYAWCLICGFAKQAYERVCCDGDRVPTTDNFACMECTRPTILEPTPNVSVKSEPLGRVTACPGCGVMIAKVNPEFLLVILASLHLLNVNRFVDRWVQPYHLSVWAAFLPCVWEKLLAWGHLPSYVCGAWRCLR